MRDLFDIVFREYLLKFRTFSDNQTTEIYINVSVCTFEVLALVKYS